MCCSTLPYPALLRPCSALLSSPLHCSTLHCAALHCREKAFEHRYVRAYAVSILRSASDEELLTFLLQLVQALRYEPSPELELSYSLASSAAPLNVPNASTAATSKAQSSGMNSPMSGASAAAGTGAGAGTSNNGALSRLPSLADLPLPVQDGTGLSPLANFLIDRACSSPKVANFLYWYLKVETEDESAGILFQAVFDAFIVQLSTSGPEGKMLFRRLCALDEYIAKISACQRDAREQGKRKEGKEQCLIKLLEQRKLHVTPSGVDWVPMPLDPTIQLTGLLPSTATMFASAVYPCVIEFIERIAEPSKEEAESGVTLGMISQQHKTHKIMFKSGDDLRQDQLIMQMISLMDILLKRVNLDMKLITYGILAVGQKDGT